MFFARVASEPGGTKRATARKSCVQAPNFFHVPHPCKHPAAPLSIYLERSVGLSDRAGRPTRWRACFVITGDREGVKVDGG
eukprot:669334-Prymnesium_polylepis.1